MLRGVYPEPCRRTQHDIQVTLRIATQALKLEVSQFKAGWFSTLEICKESLLPPLIRVICASASCINSATVRGALVQAMALIKKVSG